MARGYITQAEEYYANSPCAWAMAPKPRTTYSHNIQGDVITVLFMPSYKPALLEDKK